MYSYTLHMKKISIDNEESVPYSALVGEVGLVDSISCNVAESQDPERSCNNSESENKDARDIANCSNRSESSDNSSLGKKTLVEKEKCPDQASLHEPRNKVSSYVWEHHEINNYNNIRNLLLNTSVFEFHSSFYGLRRAYPKMSITDFYEMSNPEEKARVWALLRYIRVYSKKCCKKCQCNITFQVWS
ncbi:hypothetical protein Anas_02616 [Armadillidium nasatum]|uniref:Uncharacterized protein n=1 Tax=Armadillidium nasatum TaxID=96803 RepID=A0A5N5TIP3_9CRUS|nr:hypothetical protein Anas_02616 [Armadillidium nasatum]